MTKNTIEIELSESGFQTLRDIAAQRECSLADLARAYVEDWLDVDADQLSGRFSRNAIYRDHRMTIDERLSGKAS